MGGGTERKLVGSGRWHGEENGRKWKLVGSGRWQAVEGGK